MAKSGKLTKADMVDSVYNATGIDREDVHLVMDRAMSVLKDALAAGKAIELRGFGTFEVRIRKSRPKARNPKTGESVSVASHGVVFFKPGRELKRNVWAVENPAAIPDTEAERRKSVRLKNKPPLKRR
jgi:integration host factor subunit beta